MTKLWQELVFFFFHQLQHNVPDLSFEGRDDFVVVVVVVSAVSLNDDKITSTSLNDKTSSTSLRDNVAATASLRDNVAKVLLHEKV